MKAVTKAKETDIRKMITGAEKWPAVLGALSLTALPSFGIN